MIIHWYFYTQIININNSVILKKACKDLRSRILKCVKCLMLDMNVLKERYYSSDFREVFYSSLFRNVILVKFWIWIRRIFILWFMKYQVYKFKVLNSFYAVFIGNMILPNHGIYIELYDTHNMCVKHKAI